MYVYIYRRDSARPTENPDPTCEHKLFEAASGRGARRSDEFRRLPAISWPALPPEEKVGGAKKWA